MALWETMCTFGYYRVYRVKEQYTLPSVLNDLAYVW